MVYVLITCLLHVLIMHLFTCLSPSTPMPLTPPTSPYPDPRASFSLLSPLLPAPLSLSPPCASFALTKVLKHKCKQHYSFEHTITISVTTRCTNPIGIMNVWTVMQFIFLVIKLDLMCHLLLLSIWCLIEFNNTLFIITFCALTWIINYLYMLFICALHVLYMCFTCALHVYYMFITCRIHVIYMLFTCCVLHVNIMYVTCKLHVNRMWIACLRHVNSM